MFEGACMGFCASLGGGFCYRVATAVHCPPIEQHPNLCVLSLEHLSADATSGPNVMISHIYIHGTKNAGYHDTRGLRRLIIGLYFQILGTP